MRRTGETEVESIETSRLTIALTDFSTLRLGGDNAEFSSFSITSQRFSSLLVDNTSINPSASSPQLQPFPIFKAIVEHPNVCLPSPQARPVARPNPISAVPDPFPFRVPFTTSVSSSPSQERYPWRGTIHQWARSCRTCRGRACCSPCRPNGSRDARCEAYERPGFHLLSRSAHRRESRPGHVRGLLLPIFDD